MAQRYADYNGPTETPTPPVKPPLKWAGGKRWLVPYLRPLWRQHAWRRLVEPCCGGLAVSLELRPQTALVNDANPHLMNFYTWLQEGLTVSLPMRNERMLYYRYRERFNRLVAYGRINCQEAAELFYYLNRTGYNGLCRFNRKGLFNTPYGRHPTIHYTTDFFAYRAVLAHWTLRSGDFAELVYVGLNKPAGEKPSFSKKLGFFHPRNQWLIYARVY